MATSKPQTLKLSELLRPPALDAFLLQRGVPVKITVTPMDGSVEPVDILTDVQNLVILTLSGPILRDGDGGTRYGFFGLRQKKKAAHQKTGGAV